MGKNQTLQRLKQFGEKVVEHAKKVSIPFFDDVPLYDVALFFWRSIVDGSITTRASAIAFSFFMAFFPFIIFLFTLIPFIPDIIPFIPENGFQNELFELIRQVVPDQKTFDFIETTIDDILNEPHGGLLSFGFLMALIFSTNGLASMMSAFDATIHEINRRSWVSQRIAATYLLIILFVLLTAAITLLIGGQEMIRYLDKKDIIRDDFLLILLTVGKWIVTVSMFFFAYAFLYYFAPAKKTKWRFISAGGTLSTLLSIVTIGGFTYYINNFSQYNKLYGSIGTVLIILFLMYIMSLILLVGFELNASIYQARSNREEWNGEAKD